MDKALKQRLVGASVLIILAVIVLPMLLSGRSDTLKQESREIKLPPKPDELSIETRRFPVGVTNKSASAAGLEPVAHDGVDADKEIQVIENDEVSAGEVKLDTSLEQGVGNGADPVSNTESDVLLGNKDAETESKSSTNSKVKPPAVTSVVLSSGQDKDNDLMNAAAGLPDTPRYLVQVASFSNETNANDLASRLRADNLPVLMDVVDRAAGRLHRVRVGPYSERPDADAVVTGLRSTMTDLTPRVLDLRPSDSSPVSTPSDPLVRWVVQVGSFGSASGAEALVAELRLAGLPAFSEKVTSATGTVYKVRIGPEINREKAAELARKVKINHPDAFVTTQE